MQGNFTIQTLKYVGQYAVQSSNIVEDNKDEEGNKNEEDNKDYDNPSVS